MSKNAGRVDEVLVVRSRRTVTSLRGSCLRLSKFRIRVYGEKSAKLAHTLGRRFSLVVLSLVLPRISNFSVYERMERRGGAPVVVMSTGGSSVSGVENLKLKTSSCVAGPFDPDRLMTEIGTRVSECGHLVNSGMHGGSVIRVHKVGVSGATHHM